MWRSIPLLRPFGLLARGGPALWILERLYVLFLRRGGPALWILERLYVLFLRVRPVLQKLAR
jgi:hypothetical protein